MIITQKSQYAMRAVFELARREGCGPVKIGEIAEAQAIPPRFLENILNQLRQGGLVESRRGKEGGYLLSRLASEISAGEVIRLTQGPICVAECCGGTVEERCPFHGDCVFLPLWERASRALESVYDGTTIADLVGQEMTRHAGALMYSI
ncbi:MAG: Rrf2 family transcriptional regulator [bacterium]|nr:Rrf2 family transcriptional regulator [bacterium]